LGFTAHREKYAKALRLELEEEMARAEERLESWPKERLAKEGYALFNLRGLHDGNLQRDAVVRVLIPRGREPLAMPEPLEGAKNGDEGERRPFRRQFAMGAELPFHRFGQGDMVSLVEGDEHDPSGKNAVTGVVVERAMHFLKIAVDEEDEEKLLCAGKLRLDLSANTVSHDRALAALAAFSEQGGMPGYDVSSLQTGKRLSSSMYAPLQRAAIGIPDGDPKTPREGRESVARLAATPPPWAGKDASGAVKRAVNGTRAATLNASQQTAVRRALTRTLSVWQGPPGTGKTRALCAYVEACVFFARDENKNGKNGKAGFSGPAVLACAASNVAVDNIVDGLVRK
jgi:regulator of nonsense transcripts 1